MRIKCILLAIAALLAAAPSFAAGGDFSVKDFGAVGDGKADDTAAFAKALEAAKSVTRGAVVRVPAGSYRLTQTITVGAALLKGLDAGGWCADAAPLPTLLVDHTSGPCIIARDGASIHGFNFEYDHKGEAARKFGPTIRLSGIGISVTNVRMHQPYEGIMSDGVTNLGRLNLENVFIISARECGVYVTGTWDIPTLRNIEVWNPADYSQSHCVGFKFGHNDEIRIDNCFAFKCKTGYLFTKGATGVTWGGMTGSSADFCGEGVVVEAASALRISGGCLWTHVNGIRVQGPGKVTMTGVDIRANAGPAVTVAECDALTVTGCGVGKNGTDWPTIPAARLVGGRSVLINACTFDANGPGIVVEEKMDTFSITNNVFQPSPFQPITDKSGAGATKIISGNLTKKTAK